MINVNRPFTGDSGEFYRPKNGEFFTFRPSDDGFAKQHDLTHTIDCSDGVKYGVVKNSVAHIATGNDATGKPILEKWSIAKRTSY